MFHGVLNSPAVLIRNNINDTKNYLKTMLVGGWPVCYRQDVEELNNPNPLEHKTIQRGGGGGDLEPPDNKLVTLTTKPCLLLYVLLLIIQSSIKFFGFRLWVVPLPLIVCHV